MKLYVYLRSTCSLFLASNVPSVEFIVSYRQPDIELWVCILQHTVQDLVKLHTTIAVYMPSPANDGYCLPKSPGQTQCLERFYHRQRLFAWHNISFLQSSKRYSNSHNKLAECTIWRWPPTCEANSSLCYHAWLRDQLSKNGLQNPLHVLLKSYECSLCHINNLFSRWAPLTPSKLCHQKSQDFRCPSFSSCVRCSACPLMFSSWTSPNRIQKLTFSGSTTALLLSNSVLARRATNCCLCTVGIFLAALKISRYSEIAFGPISKHSKFTSSIRYQCSTSKSLQCMLSWPYRGWKGDEENIRLSVTLVWQKASSFAQVVLLPVGWYLIRIRNPDCNLAGFVALDPVLLACPFETFFALLWPKKKLQLFFLLARYLCSCNIDRWSGSEIAVLVLVKAKLVFEFWEAYFPRLSISLKR